ncbi:hypothetical protein CGCS363_v012669 [Colletotrichum siamense]|uniref:uncharacterized protein n=1 Tax=Colletotrichum siamense TaxID=690259 RepID=UPI0018729593|nr:uncharacterized protein CGCS363_v012669 [Colletotrichum siamense]KAF5490071.1 hypothetical protein CGCS363_v012669 [Colletotrichum siamense]
MMSASFEANALSLRTATNSKKHCSSVAYWHMSSSADTAVMIQYFEKRWAFAHFQTLQAFCNV